jgi:hypothetical protein
MCTNKGETKVGYRAKYEVSPPLANMDKLVPPPFAGPFSPLEKTGGRNPVLFPNYRSTETKYVEKRIIVEDVDKCVMRPKTHHLLKADGHVREKGRTFGVLT